MEEQYKLTYRERFLPEGKTWADVLIDEYGNCCGGFTIDGVLSSEEILGVTREINEDLGLGLEI